MMCNKLVQTGSVPGGKVDIEKKENTWVDESLHRTWGQPAVVPSVTWNVHAVRYRRRDE